MAAPDSTVRIDGLRELRASLRAAGQDYRELKGAGLEAATLVAQTASSYAPSETGALRGSIRAAGQAKGAVVRAGSAKLPYAGVIHFGWAQRSISPDPFLYDAADARFAEVEALYLERVSAIAGSIKGV